MILSGGPLKSYPHSGAPSVSNNYMAPTVWGSSPALSIQGLIHKPLTQHLFYRSAHTLTKRCLHNMLPAVFFEIANVWKTDLMSKQRVIASKRAKSLQSCPTLCDPMDCSPPGSTVHGILQARILEWVAMPSSRGSSHSRDGTCVSCIAGRFFTMYQKSTTAAENMRSSYMCGQKNISKLQIKNLSLQNKYLDLICAKKGVREDLFAHIQHFWKGPGEMRLMRLGEGGVAGWDSFSFHFTAFGNVFTLCHEQ